MDKMIEIVTGEENINKILDLFTPYLYSLSSGQIDKNNIAEKFSSNAVVFAIKTNEEIIGFSAFYCNDKKSKKAYLSMIAIGSNYRHSGLGRKLINSVEAFSKTEGMEKIYLEVRKENDSAIRFYRHMGYEYANRMEDSGCSHLMYKILC